MLTFIRHGVRIRIVNFKRKHKKTYLKSSKLILYRKITVIFIYTWVVYSQRTAQNANVWT